MEAVKGFLDSQEWIFENVEDDVLRMGFQGENAQFRCYAQVKERDNLLIFYSCLDSRVPPDRRQLAAEYLTRANYGMILGNFEMDVDDGEVRYKTVLIAEAERSPSKDQFADWVYTNVATFDRYHRGLMSVVYGSESPEAAIRLTEGA